MHKSLYHDLQCHAMLKCQSFAFHLQFMLCFFGFHLCYYMEEHLLLLVVMGHFISLEETKIWYWGSVLLMQMQKSH